MASMLGPSPDWVVGISKINLCLPDCTWAQERSFDLTPWDAGTDGGISYEVSMYIYIRAKTAQMYRFCSFGIRSSKSTRQRKQMRKG